MKCCRVLRDYIPLHPEWWNFISYFYTSLIARGCINIQSCISIHDLLIIDFHSWSYGNKLVYLRSRMRIFIPPSSISFKRSSKELNQLCSMHIIEMRFENDEFEMIFIHIWTPSLYQNNRGNWRNMDYSIST